MTASISRPVPVSFSPQHLTEFGDETRCVVAIICCPFFSWKLNVPFASDWSDTTTGWCYHQHIHSRGIKLQHRLFANAWFFCVSQTCCWYNWNQHHGNETPYPTGCASVRVATVWWLHLYIVVWNCVCLHGMVCVDTHKHTQMHNNKQIYGFSAHQEPNQTIWLRFKKEAKYEE